MTEMHALSLNGVFSPAAINAAFAADRIAIGQRANNPAVGNLVDRARIVLPKGLDHLMHGASIGLPGEIRISAKYSYLNVIGSMASARS